MSPDNNQAFGVVYTVNPFKAFFMTQNHDRSCKPVSKCTGIRHNGNAYNAVADRVSVSRVQYMRKTLSAGFEIISVVTAGCKAFVMEVHNFIDLIERRTGLGCVDADSPRFAVFSKPCSKNFAADLHQKILYATGFDECRYLIDAVALCNGRKVQG